MIYYHIYVKFTDSKREAGIHFNLSEQDVKKSFSEPYLSGRNFIFGGRRTNQSMIEQFHIFGSEKPYETLTLPNGKSPLDCDKDYVALCFGRRQVEGAFLATSFFITAIEKKETDLALPMELNKKSKIFIVHGRDVENALQLQKHLRDKLHLDAKMFEDFKEESGSTTIIEQLEYIRDNVGYSFIVATPDDLGILREYCENSQKKLLIGKEKIKVKEVCSMLEDFKTRARQNVVFEFGLFIGALGRDNVCCLLQEGTQEKPSDIDGILYTDFRKSVREKFDEIDAKLKKAGLVRI